MELGGWPRGGSGHGQGRKPGLAPRDAGGCGGRPRGEEAIRTRLSGAGNGSWAIATAQKPPGDARVPLLRGECRRRTVRVGASPGKDDQCTGGTAFFVWAFQRTFPCFPVQMSPPTRVLREEKIMVKKHPHPRADCRRPHLHPGGSAPRPRPALSERPRRLRPRSPRRRRVERQEGRWRASEVLSVGTDVLKHT